MSEDVESALVDFQRFLLDQIPPLTASDAVETLMVQPPQVAMKQVHGWAVEQSRLQQVSMADCLFHALNKIYSFATLKLIDRAMIEKYMGGIVPIAMEICPAEDRDALRTNLIAMRDTASAALVGTNLVEISRSGAAKPQTQTGPLTDVVARSARRLGLVIDRLKKFVQPAAPKAVGTTTAEGEPPQQPAAGLLAMAAASSQSDQQLREYLESLKQYT
ncbi:MAG TPA: hypothetical protein VI391_05020, partial [Thermoanaerobaculia bacterium]